MLNPQVFANATAAVMAVWVIACLALSIIVPDLLFAIAQSWMHSINIDAVKTTFNPNLGSILLGFATAVGLTWITTYAVVWLYNRWAK